MTALAGEGGWRQSLDGMWQFSTNASPEMWNTLAVPGNWDTQPAYSKYVGKGWYRRNFVVPKEWQGKHIRMQFDAVYHDAVVTLNGKEVGSHCGGYTPFEFDVTDRVEIGGTNVVVVCADNTFQRGAWWHWGGISRSVNLIANNDARIVWQHIRAEPDLAAGTAGVFVSYELANAAAQPLSISLVSQIDGLPEPALATNQVLIPAHGETVVELETVLPKERVKLWDFDHPNLYHLSTQLSKNGKMVDEESDRFGIRKVQLTSGGLLLNGEPVRLPGFNRVSDSCETGNTEPDALVRRDVDMMKSCGAVMSRLMSVPQAPNLLDYLDEKGMLIFEEIPVWQDDPQMKKDNPVTKQWLTEMIDRDYNHPCIIGWSVGNEMPKGRYAYVKSMIDFVRHDLDGHRLLTYVANTADAPDESPKTEPISESDLALVNFYAADFLPDGRIVRKDGASAKIGERIRTVRERWPDKPIFLSECGVTQLDDNVQGMIPDWENTWGEISRETYVVGAALWTFNDYRSGYKGTGPSGIRTWGVVDVERRPKAAFAQMRKLFCPVHSLVLEGKDVRIEPRGPDEIPSYILRDYQVRWVARDQAGKILQSGSINVPVLKPGSPAWSSQIAAPPVAAALEANLVTPTGYDVADVKGGL